jgi:hypothetical protein
MSTRRRGCRIARPRASTRPRWRATRSTCSGTSCPASDHEGAGHREDGRQGAAPLEAGGRRERPGRPPRFREAVTPEARSRFGAVDPSHADADREGRAAGLQEPAASDAALPGSCRPSAPLLAAQPAAHVRERAHRGRSLAGLRPTADGSRVDQHDGGCLWVLAPDPCRWCCRCACRCDGSGARFRQPWTPDGHFGVSEAASAA